MSSFAKMYLVSETDYKKIATPLKPPVNLDRKLLQDSVKRVSQKRKYQSMLASLPAAARPRLQRYDVGVPSMKDKDLEQPLPRRRKQRIRRVSSAHETPRARSPSDRSSLFDTPRMRVSTSEQLRNLTFT